jgi:hypothetical protein
MLSQTTPNTRTPSDWRLSLGLRRPPLPPTTKALEQCLDHSEGIAAGYCRDVGNQGSMGANTRGRNAEHTRSHRQISLHRHGLCLILQPSPEHCNSCYTQDTEFPGVVARPIGSFKTSSDYHYQTMRCNVDLLKIIQVGITLADEDGNYPQETSTWQFNFHFSVKYARCVSELCQCDLLT